MPVPTTRQVIPGALVNIVLKADQPTGRTVQGVVGQLLTRGNHPRGIKVRLTDGRVGRVQSMATGPTGAGACMEAAEDAGLLGDDGSARNGEGRGRREPGRRNGGGSMMVEDTRGEEQPLSSRGIGLDAYIKPTKAKGKGKGSGNRSQDAGPVAERPTSAGLVDSSRHGSADDMCPVCGDFRGDAAALMHHVQCRGSFPTRMNKINNRAGILRRLELKIILDPSQPVAAIPISPTLALGAFHYAASPDPSSKEDRAHCGKLLSSRRSSTS
ncbi:hypothetical protein VTJ83DRAFT_2826 [Remersonia thermophila]|uniref:Uncharacterized protein n=1 Tax=Remersonia thermophila TaxID=72144 RepID=A0ABR4DCB3_9PEZI